MTREETKKLLAREAQLRPIKEAYVAGKKIEAFELGSMNQDWEEVVPSWTSNCAYRIAPEMRTLYVVEYPHGFNLFETLNVAEKCAGLTGRVYPVTIPPITKG